MLLACSLFGATEVELKETVDIQATINEQQRNINNEQQTFNDHQIDINKQLSSDIENVKSQFVLLKNTVSNISSGSKDKYMDEKFYRLEDKIYRLERTLSDQDSRIRKLESKVK